MAGIRLEFAQFGHFDSFDVVRSIASMIGVADVDLPTPIATGLKSMYYVDASVVHGQVYYYKVRVWRGSTSFVSGEIVISTDTDNYWANVSSLLHFDGFDNSTIFTDEKGTIWTRNGAPVISRSQSKFSGASGRFSKNNYISTSTMAPFLFSATEDFTVESWVYIPTGATFKDNEIPIICVGAQDVSDVGGGWNLCLFDSATKFMRLERDSTGGSAQAAHFTLNEGIVRDTWHHVEFGRQGGTTYGFFNGILKGTSTVQNNIPFNSPNIQNVSIGSGNGRVLPNNWHLDGYLDDLRVTKGVCRHTANFDVPARPHPDA